VARPHYPDFALPSARGGRTACPLLRTGVVDCTRCAHRPPSERQFASARSRSRAPRRMKGGGSGSHRPVMACKAMIAAWTWRTGAAGLSTTGKRGRSALAVRRAGVAPVTPHDRHREVHRGHSVGRAIGSPGSRAAASVARCGRRILHNKGNGAESAGRREPGRRHQDLAPSS